MKQFHLFSKTKAELTKHIFTLVFIFVFFILIITHHAGDPENEVAIVKIIKKRSNEEVLYLHGTWYKHYYKKLEINGYIVTSKKDSTSYEMLLKPNQETVALLDDLKHEYNIEKRSKMAWRGKYYNIIVYNIPKLYEEMDPKTLKLNLRSFPINIINLREEDALLLSKYLFPDTVRYNISISSRINYLVNFAGKHRVLYWIPLFNFGYASAQILQVVVMGILIFVYMRMYFVSEKYSIIDYIYYKFIPFRELDALKINRLNPREHLLTILTFGKYSTHVKNYKYFDKSRVVHNNWKLKVTKEDFEHQVALGYGSFSRVTLEKFKRNNRMVAIKSMLKSGYISFFEANILACGNVCDGFVKLLYGFETPTHVHFAMDEMTGNLSQILDTIMLDHAKIYTVELGLALEALHSFRVIHRDLKPANVMIDKNYHIKLGDFGCAVNMSYLPQQLPVLTSSDFVGTPAYWAPENHKKTFTYGSDWWSYGCIVYELFLSALELNHELFNGSEIFEKLVTDTLTQGIVNRKLGRSRITYPPAIELIKQCLTISHLRNPFSTTKISDMDRFMEVPIPTNQNVNIIKKFPLRFSPEWEEVPEDRSNIAAQVLQFNLRERYYAKPTEEEETNPASDTTSFYFDYEDIECYKSNQLLRKYFNK